MMLIEKLFYDAFRQKPVFIRRVLCVANKASDSARRQEVPTNIENSHVIVCVLTSAGRTVNTQITVSFLITAVTRMASN